MAPKRPRANPEIIARPTGRPSHVADLLADSDGKLTKLLSYLQAGSQVNTAARACDLDPERIGIWLRKGKEQKRGNYRTFRDKVLQSIGESCLVAEVAIRERDPKAYRKAIATTLGEDSPYEPTTVHQPTEPTSPALTTINIMSVIQEYIAAGLLTVTDQGAGLLGKAAPVHSALLGNEDAIEGTVLREDDGT